MSARLFRILSTILLGLMVAAVGIAFAVAISIPAKLDQSQLEIACLNARANISNLEALESIAETLGLPDTIEVPQLPEECR